MSPNVMIMIMTYALYMYVYIHDIVYNVMVNNVTYALWFTGLPRDMALHVRRGVYGRRHAWRARTL